MKKEKSMHEKYIAVALASMLVMTTMLVIKLASQTGTPTIWHVGSGHLFGTIQEAINSEQVQEGDIVEVDAVDAAYVENVVVNKSLIIRRETGVSYRCIIDGNRTGPVFNVTASNVQIYNFIIQNGTYGIYLSPTSASNIFGYNNVTLNTRGIYINNSASNTLTDNIIAGNYRNLDVNGQYFTQNISSSNTVNARPVYYLVNRTDESVTSGAGFVALINCTNIFVENLLQAPVNNTDGIFAYSSRNITVRNFDIKYNDVGIHLSGSSRSTIENLDAQHNVLGISLDYSYLNTVNNNRFLTGIDLTYSNNNTIHDNVISSAGTGISLSNSDYNTFFGNNVTYSLFGIGVGESNNNTFYHNNIMYNQNPQFVGGESLNAWDNGREGNYWTNWSGEDNNTDGIIDAPYVFENVDHYPLKRPWSSLRILDVTLRNPTQYLIAIRSDHVIASLKFHLSYNSTWHDGYVYFNITAGTSGYCNVTIPRDRLDYHLYLDVNNPENVSYTVTVNATHSIVSLTYSEGQYIVKITGDRVGTIYGDITGPNGVPDGKVDMRDIGATCNNFGQDAYLNPIDKCEDE